MAYFIKQLDLVSQNEAVSIELAYPSEKNPSAVNVFCGLNASGKSLLLEQISKVLKGKKRWEIKTPIVKFSPRPQGHIPMLFIGKAWKAKDLVGETNLFHYTAHTQSIPIEEGEHRRVGRWFLAHQLAEYLRGTPDVESQLLSGNPLSPETVRLISDKFGDGQRIHLCSRSSQIVSRLERILQGTLYFRCKLNDIADSKLVFHLILAFQGGTTVPYERWSDGQRAFFYLFSALHCIHPEVVLYDEPENHQHPSLLTETLQAMKSIPGQYILATHHPHLIFSQHVDLVYYMDTVRPPTYALPPSQLEYSGRYLEQPLNRRVTRLEDSFDRICFAYRLFHDHDDQLLHQAAYLEQKATLKLFQAIENLFQTEVARDKPHPLPDAQTQQLADSIRRLTPDVGKEAVQIVDLGAGIGRQLAEMDKLSVWQVGNRIEWTCYEPTRQYREKLLQRFQTRSDVRIVKNSADLLSGKFHVCVIANVLHELTPPQFGSLIAEANRVLMPHIGSLVILELYPLVHPEGFAVPYDSTTLADILRDSGFSCDVALVPLGSKGSTAYCIFGRRDGTASRLLTQEVQSRVEMAWGPILQRTLSSYSLRSTIRDLEQHIGLLSCLTTIASICAWREGYWRNPILDEAS